MIERAGGARDSTAGMLSSYTLHHVLLSPTVSALAGIRLTTLWCSMGLHLVQRAAVEYGTV